MWEQKHKLCEEEPSAEAASEAAVAAVTNPVDEGVVDENASAFSDSDINELIGDDDSEDLGELGEAPTAEVTTETKTEVETPASEVVSKDETPTAEVKTEVEVEEETPVVETPTPESKVEATPESDSTEVSAEDVQAQRQEHRAKLITALEEEYVMSEDDAATFISSPESIMPKIAAQLHVSVLEQAMQGIVQQLPGIIESLTQQGTAVKEQENAFFSRWPALKGKGKELQNIGKVYRTLNPKVSAKDAIEAIGTLAHIQLDIPMDAVSEDTTVVETPASRPAAPAKPGAASATPAAQARTGDNPYDELVDDFLKEDAG